MSYSFQKEYTLKAQTPLIHFQPDMQGATLRATEVKPKLDKYIKNRLSRENRQLSDDWIIKNSPKEALNYKMQIKLTGQVEIVKLGMKTPYDIYYGNMGNGNSEKKGIKADCQLTIVCFDNGLREYIDSVIKDFFLVTNFGTMQGKGFGSFLIEGTRTDKSYVCRTLKNEYQANACYHFFTYPDNIFKAIKCIYSLMKTGINFHSYRRSILFDYMHEKKNIGNEKAWLKQKRIAPALGRTVKQNDTESRYVRALFGVGETIEFKNSATNPSDKVKVTMKETSKAIERLNSPVFFKVIGRDVYYVGMPINPDIYGKKFEFSSSMGKGRICVPTEQELPNDFINDFMNYAYTKIRECRRNFREIQNIQLEEVR